MKNARAIAVGGVMAALAVVIMTLGGMIPIATYVCPMLCCLLLSFVKALCGNRIGWAWYVAVSLLGLLLGPDKEAAAVFVALGYYPLIKPAIEKLPAKWLVKLLVFNAATGILYAILIFVAGMEQLLTELSSLGLVGWLVTLLLGNLCFFLLDRLLWLMHHKRRKHR